MNNYKFDSGLHAHTLEGKPLIGTSTVLSVIAKPLTWWASGLACEKFGWINKGNAKKGWTKKEDRLLKAEQFLNGIDQHTPETWLELLDEAYSAHSKKLDSSAKQGTDLHAILEHFVKTGEVKDDKILPFVKWAESNVKRWLWSEANCFSKEWWTGGISDVGAELNDGSYAIIDFKSSKEAYDTQFWQCWGYAKQIEENGFYDEQGNKLGELDKPIDRVCIVPFGADVVEPVFHYGREDGIKAFESALFLYKLTNK